MWLLACLLCFSLSLVVGQQSGNATLSTIDLIPCKETIYENVSLYKSDIYTVLNNLSFCQDSWTPNTTNGFRVRAHADQNTENFQHTPVVFVARQQQDGIVSWSIPLQPYGFSALFYQVNRTVCPISPNVDSVAPLLYIDVFSSSPEPIKYSISIEAVKDFALNVSVESPVVVNLTTGASAPQMLYVKFPEDSDMLTVEAKTEDNKCAFISIQNNSCPVNDLLNTARSLGIFQTMSLTAFLTVKASEVNDREFLIVIITTNYSVCHSSKFEPPIPIEPADINGVFEQSMELEVKRLPPISRYALAIALPLMVFGGVWVIGLLIPFFCCPQIRWTIRPPKCRWVKCQKEEKEEQLLSDDSAKQNYSSKLRNVNNEGRSAPSVLHPMPSYSSS